MHGPGWGTLQQLWREHRHQAARIRANDFEDAAEVIQLIRVQKDVHAIHAAVLVNDQLEKSAQGTSTSLMVAEEGIVFALRPQPHCSSEARRGKRANGQYAEYAGEQHRNQEGAVRLVQAQQRRGQEKQDQKGCGKHQVVVVGHIDAPRPKQTLRSELDADHDAHKAYLQGGHGHQRCWDHGHHEIVRGEQQGIVVALRPEAAKQEFVFLQHFKATPRPQPTGILPGEKRDGTKDRDRVGQDAQTAQDHKRRMLIAPADHVRARCHRGQAIGVQPALERPHHSQGHGRKQCYHQDTMQIYEGVEANGALSPASSQPEEECQQKHYRVSQQLGAILHQMALRV